MRHITLVFLSFSACLLVSATNEINELQRKHALELAEEIAREGGDPIRTLQETLDQLKQTKHSEHQHIPNLFEHFSDSDEDKFEDAGDHFGNFNDDEDDHDHEYSNYHLGGAHAAAFASASGGGAGAMAMSSFNNDYHHDSSTSGPANEPNLVKSTSTSTNPISGETTHKKVMEKSPSAPGDAKVVSLSTSTTSADGSKKSSSSFTRSESFLSSSNRNLSPIEDEAPHDLLGHKLDEDPFDIEESLSSTHNHNVHHDQHHFDEDDLPLSSDEDTTDHRVSDHDDDHEHNDDHHHHHDEVHSDSQPKEENFEHSFIDHSDPTDPKKVHIKKQGSSEVTPNSSSHQHHESISSTSLGQNPNSFHHSSSSYSSSHSIETNNNKKSASKKQKKHKRHAAIKLRQVQRRDRQIAKQVRNSSKKVPQMPPMPPMPPMPFMPLAVMPYGVQNWPTAMNYQMPYGLGMGMLPKKHVSKKQARKIRKSMKKAERQQKIALENAMYHP